MPCRYVLELLFCKITLVFVQLDIYKFKTVPPLLKVVFSKAYRGGGEKRESKAYGEKKKRTYIKSDTRFPIEFLLCFGTIAL